MPGHVVQVEFERFADQQFVQPAVFAQDEGVVEAGDQQDVAARGTASGSRSPRRGARRGASRELRAR